MRLIAASAFVLLTLLVSVPSGAYDADLVPVRNRPEAREMTGRVSITGEDGTVRATVTDVLDSAGDPLDDRFLTLELRLRVNGLRRRFVLGVPVSLGDGEAEESLGLQPGSRIIVSSVKLRGPQRKVFAEAGALTAAPVDGPPGPPGPPPTADECPSALESCQSDLVDCTEELDACESF
jgi:hypothetical protein